MKKVLSEFKIYALYKHRKKLLSKYNWHWLDNRNKRNTFLVLYWFFFPWIIRNYSAPVNQKKSYKVIARFPGFESLKHLLYGDYDVYFSSGLYSVNSQIAFIITRLRGKENGVLVKEFHFKKHNLLARINNLLTKLIADKRNFYIAYSSQSYHFLEEKLNVSSSKIYYIPKTRKDYSTIEFDENRLKEIRDLFFKNDKINILFLGRVVPVKGVDILLKSLLPLNDRVHLVIAGNDESSYAWNCKKFALENELDVVFAGRIGEKKSSKEVVYFYRNADLFVLPNKHVPNEYEAVEVWGSVVDEALDLGLPVIVTDITGCSEDLVKNKNVGKVVRQNSVQDLRDAIIHFIENQEQWKKMGKNGPRIINQKNEENFRGWKEILYNLQAL